MAISLTGTHPRTRPGKCDHLVMGVEACEEMGIVEVTSGGISQLFCGGHAAQDITSIERANGEVKLRFLVPAAYLTRSQVS